MKKIFIVLLLFTSMVSFGQLRKDQLNMINARDIKAFGSYSSFRMGKLIDSLILSLESQRRASGYIPVGNGSGISVDVPLSGDGTLSSAGALSVTKILGNTIPSNASGVLTNNGSGSLSWGASVTSFQTLTDGPGAFTGKSLNHIRINSGETFLEYRTPSQTLSDIGGIGLSSLSATSPIFYNNSTGVISSQAATTSLNGYLTSTDWNTFNNKGSGSVTSVASADGSVTITNPTTTVDLSVVKSPKWSNARNLGGNSIDGSANVAFANKFIVQGTTDTGLSGAQFLGALGTGIVKNTTTTGVLSIAIAADFPTLNQNTTGSAATLTTGRTISITGDLAYTSPSFDGSGNVTAAGTLATVNSNVGSFGSATQVGSFTVNGKGLITAASNITVTPAVGSITGLGIGVSTALGINVGSAGAFVTFNGAGGTPSSMVGTNITGTASGLTAGNVTTNANLTGPITSVGNATSIASQTGTGTTFMMSASPSYTGTATYGTLGFSDTDIAFSFQKSVNSYFQIDVQNTSSGATASTDIVINNDASTASTHYLDLGKNSSGFTGSGSLNGAGYSYMTSTTDDLVIGTTTSNTLRFITNSSTTDRFSIDGTGLVTFVAPVPLNSITNTFTATANSQYAFSTLGTATARSTASDVLIGDQRARTLVSAAASQTLIADLVNATFTDVNSATKYIFDLQNAGSNRFTVAHDGSTTITAGNSSTSSTLKIVGIGSTTNKAFQVTQSGGSTEAFSVTDGGTTTITSAGSSATMFQVVGTLTTSISGAGAITMTSLLPTSNSAAVTIFGGRDVVAGSVQIRPQNVFDQNNGSNINLRLNPTFAYGTGGSTNVGSNLKLDYTINNTGGTLSTIRGIWIKPTETSLTNTTHYSIVSETTTGKGGVATAAPTDYWTIGAGTSTIAPFGLTSGTDLSSPANGKMEYDGINLKFTPASTTRKVVSLYQVGRSTAQTAANASVVTWTVGANDGTFLVSANVIPTTSTLHNFTVTCSYTDETNTARVVTLNFSQLAGTFVTAIANAAGAVPYEGIPLQIRCKAGTTITIGSTGTFTTVTYNIEGSIAQIN